MRLWTVYVAEDDGGAYPAQLGAVDAIKLSAVTGTGDDLYPDDLPLWEGQAHDYEQAIRRARGHLRNTPPNQW